MIKFDNLEEFYDTYNYKIVPPGTYVAVFFKDGHVELYLGKSVRLSEEKMEIRVDDQITIYWKKRAMRKVACVEVVKYV